MTSRDARRAWLKRHAGRFWKSLDWAWQRGGAWFTRVCKERTWYGHALRAGVRYNEAKGTRLAAALTYRSFLAVFPVLLLAFSVLGFVLQGNANATREVASYLEENLPTLQVDVIAKQRLTAGIIGLVGVLFAGLSWVQETRTAVRAMWNKTEDPGALWLAKLVDVVVMLTLGAVMAMSVVATFAFTAAAALVLDLAGVPAHGTGFQVVSLLLAVCVNIVLVALLLTFVPRLDMPFRRLWVSALLGGVALEVLKQFAQLFVGYAVTNPAYAVVATAVGLLLFLNFFNRLLLFCAAITATSSVGTVRDKPALTFHGWRYLRRGAKGTPRKSSNDN
ncbi:MAG: hypothetical protein DLM55_06565 [Acidimicrobiales bacterium]|nr:MAG: hypothetical protein DLM55_06565 [Acidimicrobiales bacterium]